MKKSEELSAQLNKLAIKHNILNARHHEQEAQIIEEAGLSGNVTIATNMAGRGTDIQLGGNLKARVQKEATHIQNENEQNAAIQKIQDEVALHRQKVLDAGGLAVIATERHESRRIDNQLRGRAGRQGDPGYSRFYLSLEDDLMRRFGSDRLDTMLRRFNFKEGEFLEHRWVTKALERAQRNVEINNFEIRKQALRYDDVLNDQRNVIYEQRRDIMQASPEDLKEDVLEMHQDVARSILQQAIPAKAHPEEWDLDLLAQKTASIFHITADIRSWAKEEGVDEEVLFERITGYAKEEYLLKKEKYGESFDNIERSIILQVIDKKWQDHLLTLEHLRQSIGLRAYGQRNPLDEYKREAFILFESLLYSIREQITATFANMVIEEKAPEQQAAQPQAAPSRPQKASPSSAPNVFDAPITAAETHNPTKKMPAPVSRNAPCPCGSGRKFKHCHGAI